MTNFETLMDEVVFEAANPAVPAGFETRVLERVWAEGMERRMAAPTLVPRQSAAVLRFDTVARVKGGRSARSTGVAVLLHLAALLLLGAMVRSGVKLSAPVKMAMLTDVSVPPPAPPKASAVGGGGGQRGPAPVSKGALPKFTDMQLVAPKAPPMVEAKIKIEPTIEVQKDVKMASNLPNFGMPNSPVVGMSMGNGSGTGMGNGYGSGLGPGSGGNTGGGVKHVGGGVSAPVLVFQVEPQFSEEARRAKVSGNVIVNLWVDEKGSPSHVRVLKGVGMGLDEKAMEAVSKYRFKPAMEGGRPVTVEVNVEVGFQIF